MTLRRFGVDTTFVAGCEPDDLAAAITPVTKLLFAEVVANPSGDVLDIAGAADTAHAHGIPLVVDATTVTPYLCRPIEHGADIVLHSATKFLGGHGTTLGGVVVESGRRTGATATSRRSRNRSPRTEGFDGGRTSPSTPSSPRCAASQLRDIGSSLTPIAAFLLLQGVETLPQRMDAHMANAARCRRVVGR